jgi:Kef-type K+ transport system membrane component KefB
MSLMDLKKIKTLEAATIIGAAIMDDVIGLIVITISFLLLNLVVKVISSI